MAMDRRGAQLCAIVLVLLLMVAFSASSSAVMTFPLPPKGFTRALGLSRTQIVQRYGQPTSAAPGYRFAYRNKRVADFQNCLMWSYKEKRDSPAFWTETLFEFCGPGRTREELAKANIVDSVQYECLGPGAGNCPRLSQVIAQEGINLGAQAVEFWPGSLGSAKGLPGLPCDDPSMALPSFHRFFVRFRTAKNVLHEAYVSPSVPSDEGMWYRTKRLSPKTGLYEYVCTPRKGIDWFHATLYGWLVVYDPPRRY